MNFLTSSLQVVRILNCSCKQQAELHSRELDGLLTRPERAAVRFHTLFCRGCRRNRRQFALLRDAAEQLAAHMQLTLDPERAQRILKQITEQ